VEEKPIISLVCMLSDSFSIHCIKAQILKVWAVFYDEHFINIVESLKINIEALEE